MERLYQGAEAVLYKDKNQVLKHRIRKSYRIKEIDYKIRKQNTRKEVKLLQKANKIINTPRVLSFCDKETKIIMEYIAGDKLKDSLNSFTKVKKKQVANQIGRNIAKLHQGNIIHGDLTTSNMILNKKGLFFIDFGLGFISEKEEDKAVDLHLLRQAFNSTHYKYANGLFNEVLTAYKSYKDYKKVLNRLEKVEIRGRNKKSLILKLNSAPAGIFSIRTIGSYHFL